MAESGEGPRAEGMSSVDAEDAKARSEPASAPPQGFRASIWKTVSALLLLAVTALVVPALTRQWQDRQKARDVRAGLVVDMSTSISTALSTAETLNHETPSPATQQAYFAELTTWRSARAAISGRLATYIPDVRQEWDTLASEVDDTYRLVAAQPGRVAIVRELEHSPGLHGVPGSLHAGQWASLALRARTSNGAASTACSAKLVPHGQPRHPRGLPCFARAYEALVRQLTIAQNDAIRLILRRGVAGYTASFQSAFRDDL